MLQLRPTSLALATAAALALPLTTSCSPSDAESGSDPDGEARPPAVAAEPVEYSSGDTTLQGYVARPKDADGDRPAVIVVHEWWGHNDYARGRAEELAEAGYVAFALDMYGDGRTAAHPEDATAFMQSVMGNAEVMEARFDAAVELVKGMDGVDGERIAAIGYCMGGGIVLRMARTSDDLTAVASFHGSLGAALGMEDSGSAHAVYLAHGRADEFVTMEQMEQLEQELSASEQITDVRSSVFEGAKHGFTNPAATRKGEEFDLPLAYDEEADERSWETLLEFLGEHLGGA